MASRTLKTHLFSYKQKTLCLHSLICGLKMLSYCGSVHCGQFKTACIELQSVRRKNMQDNTALDIDILIIYIYL